MLRVEVEEMIFQQIICVWRPWLDPLVYWGWYSAWPLMPLDIMPLCFYRMHSESIDICKDCVHLAATPATKAHNFIVFLPPRPHSIKSKGNLLGVLVQQKPHVEMPSGGAVASVHLDKWKQGEEIGRSDRDWDGDLQAVKNLGKPSPMEQGQDVSQNQKCWWKAQTNSVLDLCSPEGF